MNAKTLQTNFAKFIDFIFMYLKIDKNSEIYFILNKRLDELLSKQENIMEEKNTDNSSQPSDQNSYFSLDETTLLKSLKKALHGFINSEAKLGNFI